MEKLDLLKLYKEYYSASVLPKTIEIDQAQFLAIEGQGDPSGAAFAGDIEALYSVAYTVKFMCKWDNQDFVVPKLEGLWWYDETKYHNISADATPQQVPREEWQYRLMLRMPDYVTNEQVTMAIKLVIKKKGLNRAEDIILQQIEEGRAVQLLHVGPFDTEPQSLTKLHSFMNDHKLQRNGLHHEIYLSDFRKTPPEKLRTILRQPFVAA